MAKSAGTVGERVGRCLDAARPADLRDRVTGTPLRVTSARLRAWAQDYLADCDAEAGKPHSNLWMDDGGNKVGPGHFAVILFWPPPRGLEVFSGVGISLPVQRFCMKDEPNDLGALYEAMASEFVVGRLLRVNRAAAERWLGRGW
jgi:hypothetical protein